MFSWGRQQQNNVASRPPPPPPPPSHSQNSSSAVSSFLRNDHIQSYVGDKTLGPSTRRVSQDDTTYDTVFQTRYGDALILRVHFPQASSSRASPPVMTLVGVRATHPWLDNSMRITGYPQINNPENWARSNLKLGAAVNAVVRHLQLEPPNVIQVTDISLQRLQSSLQKNKPKPNNSTASSNSSHISATTSTRPEPESPPPPDYDAINFRIPTVPTEFPELENLSYSELQKLYGNEEAFQNLVQSMSSVSTLKDLMQSIFKGNVETAHAHIDQNQEQLETLHAEVSALHDELQGKVQTFQSLEKQLPKSDTDDTVGLIRKLTKAKKEALNESEKLASRWVDDKEAESSMNDFVEEFLEKRVVHHLRAAKIERIQEENR